MSNRSPRNQQRETLTPIKVERPLSQSAAESLVPLAVEGFMHGMTARDPEHLKVTLLSRRMANSYINRAGSKLSKSPEAVARVLKEALPQSAQHPLMLGVAGLRLVGYGYTRGIALDLEPSPVEEETLAMHEALWQQVHPNMRGRRPERQTAHVGVGHCTYELGEAALSQLLEYAPAHIELEPAHIVTDAYYRNHRAAPE